MARGVASTLVGIAEVKELAREHTGKAVETLVSLMTNPKFAPGGKSVCCKRAT